MPHPLITIAHSLASLDLLPRPDLARVESVCSPLFPFADEFRLARSTHLHIKVADTARLPLPQLSALGWATELDRPGFLVLAPGPCAGVSFSSIPISDDDLRADQPTPRRKPFLDHIGIDLLDQSDLLAVRAKAAASAWPALQQGGRGQPVSCCYATVATKIWVFPSEPPNFPIEFAFGEQATQDDSMGRDLRPSCPVTSLTRQ